MSRKLEDTRLAWSIASQPKQRTCPCWSGRVGWVCADLAGLAAGSAGVAGSVEGPAGRIGRLGGPGRGAQRAWSEAWLAWSAGMTGRVGGHGGPGRGPTRGARRAGLGILTHQARSSLPLKLPAVPADPARRASRPGPPCQPTRQAEPTSRDMSAASATILLTRPASYLPASCSSALVSSFPVAAV